MSASNAMDLLLIAVFAACVWLAARKGIFHALSGLLGSAAGLAGAFLLTPRVQPVTAGIIRPFVSGMVEKAAEAAGLQDLLASPVAQDTRDAFVQILRELSVPAESWEAMTVSAEEAGQMLSQAAGQALAAQFAPVITFVVLFLLIQLGVRVLCSLLSLDIPLLRSVNKMGGAALGAVTGLCMVVALCWGVVRFAPDRPDGLISRPAMLQSTVGGAVCDIFGFEQADTPQQ